MNRSLCAAALALFCLAGCKSPDVSKADLAAAKDAVKSGLEAWKKGEAPKQLAAMEFHDDDWKAGAKLVEYEIVKVYGQPDGLARCSVKLVVQPRQRGKQPVRKEATYHVVLRPKVIVAGDPMA